MTATNSSDQNADKSGRDNDCKNQADDKLAASATETDINRVPSVVINFHFSPQNTSAGGSNIVSVGNAHAAADGNHELVAGQTFVNKKRVTEESWWHRWRKRGLVLGLATIVAAVVAVLQWLEWTPWL